MVSHLPSKEKNQLVTETGEDAVAYKMPFIHLPDVKYRVDRLAEASGSFGPIDKRPKSPAFHAGVTGSNPVGITIAGWSSGSLAAS